MRKEIIISGSGGQGIMFAGTILCYAGIEEGKFVTFFPSYGAEMRGGTANCQVIISDEPIGSPVVESPDILVCFNKQSFDKFLSKTKKKGSVFTNFSLDKNKTKNLNIIEVPGNDLAEKCGSALVLNLVMMGALAADTEIVMVDSLVNIIPEMLTAKKKKFWDMNKNAVRCGAEYMIPILHCKNLQFQEVSFQN